MMADVRMRASAEVGKAKARRVYAQLRIITNALIDHGTRCTCPSSRLLGKVALGSTGANWARHSLKLHCALNLGQVLENARVTTVAINAPRVQLGSN